MFNRPTAAKKQLENHLQVGQKCNIEDMRRAKNTPPIFFIKSMNNEILEIFVKMLRGIWDILRTAADVRLVLMNGVQLSTTFNYLRCQ